MAQVATLGEIERHWSIVDLMNANILLDLREEAERRQLAEVRQR